MNQILTLLSLDLQHLVNLNDSRMRFANAITRGTNLIRNIYYTNYTIFLFAINLCSFHDCYSVIARFNSFDFRPAHDLLLFSLAQLVVDSSSVRIRFLHSMFSAHVRRRFIQCLASILIMFSSYRAHTRLKFGPCLTYVQLILSL